MAQETLPHEQDEKPNSTAEAPPKKPDQDQHFGPTPERSDQEQGEESEEGEEDNEDEEEEEEEDLVQPEDEQGRSSSGAGAKHNDLFRRLSSERVSLRVHDVLIKGNTKTKDFLIEAQFEALKRASSMQELLQAAALANARLRSLDIFDSVSVTIDAGPPELPGTANVLVEVVETLNPLTGDLGVFSKPEARSWSLEGSLKYKNIFGYGDIWDASGAYGWDQTSELSTGLTLPRFKALSTPLVARISMLSQDWLKFSSYKERLLGLSVGLLSTEHHDLGCNLTWRTLLDPSHASSKSIRRQLGHSLLSSIKYTYKVERRDSHLRPTCGYAFASTSQIGGLVPDSRSLRCVRQEFDLRCAFPLGFYKAAINLGVSAGLILPWSRGFMNTSTPLPERFFIGGHASPVCSMAGPTMLLGFKSRGLGPTDARRLIIESNKDDSNASVGRDVLGGDLAVTAFVDLSFDLPLKLLRDSGIHGHMFVCAGNLAKLSENEFKSFSLQNFVKSFRSSAGLGMIIPTKLFRMEINYCYILKQFEHDRGKTGLQFCFSSPS